MAQERVWWRETSRGLAAEFGRAILKPDHRRNPGIAATFAGQRPKLAEHALVTVGITLNEERFLFPRPRHDRFYWEYLQELVVPGQSVERIFAVIDRIIEIERMIAEDRDDEIGGAGVA